MNELVTFNPDMGNKPRVLAVTKSDLLDEELIAMLHEDLPEGLPVVFISSVTGMGIQALKDLLWNELNNESNKIQAIQTEKIVHRNRDVRVIENDFSDWQDDTSEEDEEVSFDEDYDSEFIDEDE